MRGLVLLMLVACAGGARNKNEDLVDDMRELHEGLRWRNYDKAAERVPAVHREHFLDAHEELDGDLRIDDYEVERVTLDKDGVHATARVKYVWHKDSVGRVVESVVDEKWERQGKTWRIVEATHRRGEPLPPAVLPAPAPAVP